MSHLFWVGVLYSSFFELHSLHFAIAFSYDIITEGFQSCVVKKQLLGHVELESQKASFMVERLAALTVFRPPLLFVILYFVFIFVASIIFSVVFNRLCVVLLRSRN